MRSGASKLKTHVTLREGQGSLGTVHGHLRWPLHSQIFAGVLACYLDLPVPLEDEPILVFLKIPVTTEGSAQGQGLGAGPHGEGADTMRWALRASAVCSRIGQMLSHSRALQMTL